MIRTPFFSALTSVGLLLSLSACSGGVALEPGGTGPTSSAATVTPPPTTPTALAVPTVSLDFSQANTLTVQWTAVDGATHYKVLEDPDGVSGYTQLGTDFTAGTLSADFPIGLHQRVNARYTVQSCNAAGCVDSQAESVDVTEMVNSIAYLKASNTGASDLFGYSVSVSGDGNTLAVGTLGEDSNAVGVGGDQSNDSASGSGAVYVFSRSGVTWVQQAYLKASNTGASDQFGASVSVSHDGNTLAVGTLGEDSNAVGVGGDQSNNSASSSGAVYVFSRSGVTWVQQAYLKASNAGAFDYFGRSVSVSGDGNTLAVGAYAESSNAVGVGGDQSNNSAVNAGAVYVFSRSGVTWVQQAYLKASNTGANDQFGYSVSVSNDGNTLAVGAFGEDSNAVGVGGDQSNDSASNSGAVYVFSRSGVTWVQQAYLKASNTGASDQFGASVSVSHDGNTLAVGAYAESSNAVGVGGDQSNDSASSSGAVYVFSRSGVTWVQQAYLKASNTGASDQFGASVSVSHDGNTLAVGAYAESSNAVGVGGDQSNDSASSSGAVYVFSRSGVTWVQQAYLKASNAGAFDYFGRSLSVSHDGNTLAVGVYDEDSNAVGEGGDQDDNSASNAGAVYVY